MKKRNRNTKYGDLEKVPFVRKTKLREVDDEMQMPRGQVTRDQLESRQICCGHAFEMTLKVNTAAY